MLRAVIFDFDGILVDSEPLIFRLTQQMAALEGWSLSEEEYYRDYLARDDRGIVAHLFETHGLPVDPKREKELLDWKARAYWEAIRDGLPAVPGAVEFVKKLAANFPLAIASGSFRREIEHLLIKLGLRDKFPVLVAADDCQRSKPDPEVFLKALAGLQQLAVFAGRPLTAAECLAIEDAPGGVEAARAAGMKCLALLHSRSAEELDHADWTCREFSQVDLERIIATFSDRP